MSMVLGRTCLVSVFVFPRSSSSTTSPNSTRTAIQHTKLQRGVWSGRIQLLRDNEKTDEEEQLMAEQTSLKETMSDSVAQQDDVPELGSRQEKGAKRAGRSGTIDWLSLTGLPSALALADPGATRDYRGTRSK